MCRWKLPRLKRRRNCGELSGVFLRSTTTSQPLGTSFLRVVWGDFSMWWQSALKRFLRCGGTGDGLNLSRNVTSSSLSLEDIEAVSSLWKFILSQHNEVYVLKDEDVCLFLLNHPFLAQFAYNTQTFKTRIYFSPRIQNFYGFLILLSILKELLIIIIILNGLKINI